MKKSVSFILAIFLLFSTTITAFAAIGDVNSDNNVDINDATELQRHIAELITLSDEALKNADTNRDGVVTISDVTKIQRAIVGLDTLEPKNDTNILVAYFSATGTTRPLANYISEITGADIYEITAAEPYTAEDLDYTNSNSRTSKERYDSTVRPAISGAVKNMADYDVIFLGYPIWHGQSPKIISTFLESYDFSGKTIIPFCTSASSGIGSSATNLHSLAPNASWLSGRRFSAGTTKDTLKEWIDSMNILPDDTQVEKLLIQIGDYHFTATLEENEAVSELVAMMKYSPITINMSDYAGFEKVGSLGTSLTTSNSRITTDPGDIVLYNSNQIVMFYGSNTWSYTKLAHVDDLTNWETALGSGAITAVLSVSGV